MNDTHTEDQRSEASALRVEPDPQARRAALCALVAKIGAATPVLLTLLAPDLAGAQDTGPGSQGGDGF